MTPKEELIQAIERSPDETVQEFLAMLQALQHQQRPKIIDLQPDSQETVLERMGGVPKHLLSAGNLSDRDCRRAVIADRLQQRH